MSDVSDLSTKHVGLKNEPYENNCFLNATIQALWHLDTFRNRLIAAVISPDDVLLSVVQALFVQYQFTELKVIPPTELRNALLDIDESKFRLGQYADASEAMEAILDGIHNDHVDPSNPADGCNPRCLSHHTFGGLYLSQCTCSCGATSEPLIDDSSFLLYTSAAALITWRDSQAHAAPSYTDAPISFGQRLHHCLKSPRRTCPSAPSSTATPSCRGAAETKTWCLSPPSVLALCVSWESEWERAETIERFLHVMDGYIFLDEVYRTDILPEGSAESQARLSCKSSSTPVTPSGRSTKDRIQYIFRGFVCYYGKHYVSICKYPIVHTNPL